MKQKNKNYKKVMIIILLILLICGITALIIGMKTIKNNSEQIAEVNNGEEKILADTIGTNVSATLSSSGALTIRSTTGIGTIDKKSLNSLLGKNIDSSSNTTVKTITFANKVYAPADSSYLFGFLRNLTTVNNASYLDTSKATNMQYMFAYCESLTSIDVSNWDTSHVTLMNSMFFQCANLTSIDVSKWNTSNVKLFEFTFACCRKLESIDMSNWDMSKAVTSTAANQTLAGCDVLTDIYTPKIYSAKTVNLYKKYYNLTNLTDNNTYSSFTNGTFNGSVHLSVKKDFCISYQQQGTITRKNNASELGANEVTAGDKITYTIKVNNIGNVKLENIEVKAAIPDGTKLVSIANKGVQNGEEISWEIAELAVGKTKELSYTVEVEYAEEEHTITSTAEVDVNKTNTVTYTYKKPDPTIKSEITNESTVNKITSKDTPIYYEIEYNGEVGCFNGKAVVTIVNQLPYPIDEEKSELYGGVYDKNTQTITWIEEIEDIDTFETGDTKEIKITKPITLSYEYGNLNETTGVINNVVETKIELQKPSEENPDEYETVKEFIAKEEGKNIAIEIPTEVIIHHYIYNKDAKTEEEKYTEIKLIEDEIIEGIVGKEYETSRSNKITSNYTCIDEMPNGYTGIATEEPIEVSYYYELKKSTVESSIDKETIIGTEDEEGNWVIGEDEEIKYVIEYKPVIKDYIGDAKVEIVATLPTGIEKEKSELDDGIYDEEKHTITWIKEIKDIDTFKDGDYEEEIIKEITIVYDVEEKLEDVEIKVEGKTEIYYPNDYLDKGGETIEEEPGDGTGEEEQPEKKTKGKVIIKYQDKEGKDIIQNGLIIGKIGNTYNTKQKEIENCNFIEVIGNETGIIGEEDTIVTYIYERIPAKVIVKYLSQEGKKTIEISPSETIEGYAGQKYETGRKVVKGYKAIKPEPANAVGKMTKETIEVTYYYEKIGSGIVKVKYVDIDTKEEIIKEGKKTYGYEIKGYAGDKYKTEEKEIPYYVFEKATDNTTGELTETGDTVIYYYRKLAFNFSIKQTIESITLNGKPIKFSDNEITKVEIKSGEVENAELIIKYNIKVTNEGELAGSVKVLDIIPKGYEIIGLPEYWDIREDGALETDVYLEPGESKDLKLTLKWINGEENLGSSFNKVEIESTTNIANFKDINVEDDTGEVILIVSIKTGEVVNAIIIIMLMISFGISGYMMNISIRRMRKGQDINDIRFLK